MSSNSAAIVLSISVQLAGRRAGALRCHGELHHGPNWSRRGERRRQFNLLRLIGGEILPTSGTISETGEVGYLSESLTWRDSTTMADLLGIAPIVAAIRAVEGGDVDERHFDTIGDYWDIEARADEHLRRVGFSADDLDRSVSQLSGGEVMLIAITGLRVRRLPITLLDEPGNNLDRAGKAMLAELLTTWPGTLVVVSHDLDLRSDGSHSRAVLRAPHALRRSIYGVEGEPGSAAGRTVHAMQAAEHAVKAERRQRDEAESKLAKRSRTAKTANESKRGSKILMNGLASRAEKSAGKLRSGLDDRLDDARGSRESAAARARPDQRISLNLPDPDVAASRGIAELHGTNRSFAIQGPERIALAGLNGVGKTTLVENLLGLRATAPGRASGTLHTDRVGYLSQRLDGLDEGASALENIRLVASGVGDAQIRNQLGRLLIKGDNVSRPASTLSGGERFRVLSRDCCSPTHRHSCSFWMNRRTTWTWSVSTSSSKR